MKPSEDVIQRIESISKIIQLDQEGKEDGDVCGKISHVKLGPMTILVMLMVDHAQADTLRAKTSLDRSKPVCLKMKHARRHDGIINNKPVHSPDSAS
jgi:hypothetical protein